MSLRVKLKGFTLIETVLAIAMSAVIMLSLTTIFQVGKNSWNDNNDRSEVLQHARMVISRLGSELRYATNLTMANTGGITFDTKVLLDSNELTTEVIRYQAGSGTTLERSQNGGPWNIIAGDISAGLTARILYVSSMYLVGDVLTPGGPLSSAVALELTIRVSKGRSSVDVRTLSHFRGK